MSHQNTHGLFEYVPSISKGDPYTKMDETRLHSKHRGKQFQTNPVKSGRTPDVYFDAGVTKSVYVGSKYTTLFDQDRKYQLEKKKKQIVPAPFKPSNPSNNPEGLGSYYGAFNKWANEKDTDAYDRRKLEKGKVWGGNEPKNFLTEPAKKGHVGLLSCKKDKNMAGVAGEYKYEYNPPLPRQPKETLVPFKPSSPPKKGLYSADCGVTFTKMVYKSDGFKEKKRKEPDGLKPWNPAHVILSKGPTGRIYGTINSFPEYKEQGLTERRPAKADDPEKRIGPVFRPSSCPKTMRSFSIANMPRNVANS